MKDEVMHFGWLGWVGLGWIRLCISDAKDGIKS